MKESELSRAVTDYLEYGMNQGKWWFTRLNSGMAFKKYKDKYYAIKLCPAGTADFLIIRWWYPIGAPNKGKTIVSFLELKSTKGKTTKEQDDFAEQVRNQGAGFYEVRSLEEIEVILSK